jgi:hypothetical protein
MAKKTSKKHSVLVLVEFDNTAPYVERFTSKKPITLQRVVARIEDTVDDVNWDKDGVTILGEITENDMD